MKPPEAAATTPEQTRRITRMIVGAMAPYPVSDPSPASQLLDDLEYDSLRLVELAVAIETRFGLAPIASKQTLAVQTVGDVEELVLQLLEAREG